MHIALSFASISALLATSALAANVVSGYKVKAVPAAKGGKMYSFTMSEIVEGGGGKSYIGLGNLQAPGLGRGVVADGKAVLETKDKNLPYPYILVPHGKGQRKFSSPLPFEETRKGVWAPLTFTSADSSPEGRFPAAAEKKAYEALEKTWTTDVGAVPSPARAKRGL